MKTLKSVITATWNGGVVALIALGIVELIFVLISLFATLLAAVGTDWNLGWIIPIATFIGLNLFALPDAYVSVLRELVSRRKRAIAVQKDVACREEKKANKSEMATPRKPSD